MESNATSGANSVVSYIEPESSDMTLYELVEN